MKQTEKTTKDISTGGLDVSLTLDHTLLRGDFDKLGKDVTKTIATGAFIGRNTAYVIGASDNDYSGKGASKEIKGSNIFERIWEVSSGAQESETEQSLAKLDTNMQGAVDIINNMQSHTTEELEGALELLQGVDIYMYADLNAKAKAFITHREEGEPEKINLNLGTVDILTPEKTIFTTKHEGYHLDLNLTADEAHQESLANAKGFGAASGWELYNVLNNNEVGERSENDLTIWRTKNLGTKNIIKNTKEVAKIPMNERQNYLLPVENSIRDEALSNCLTEECVNKVNKKYYDISNKRDNEFLFAGLNCLTGNCDDFDTIHVDLRSKLNEPAYELFLKSSREFTEAQAKKSIYHNIPSTEVYDIIFNSNGNKKYLNGSGNYEVVIDKDSNFITNSTNGGTYNFYEPNDIFNHGLYDVFPYFLLGNSDSDSTVITDRILRNLRLITVE